MAKQEGLHAYEERYKRLCAAGALYWNDPQPNIHLSRIIEHLPSLANCIEFGCGEGFQARFLASNGFSVTAIDLSPTVITRAIEETPSTLQVRFIVGDVTDRVSLQVPKRSYDLAVDIGCLHMMSEGKDRANYLDLIRDTLKPGGKFFLQNGLDLDDVNPETDDDIRQLNEMKQLTNKPPGYLVPRKIMTVTGEQEIMVPLCPTCKFPNLNGYSRELISHGFRILSAERGRGVNCIYEAIILAEKS